MINKPVDTKRNVNAKAKFIFGFIVDYQDVGLSIPDIHRMMKKEKIIKPGSRPDILSLLEHAGYLIYTDNGKIYPFKDCHTGTEYY